MTAPTPSPEEPRIVVRPQYVRLGAVLIALETSKSLREALRAVHDLKTEQFDNASLTAPLREEVERLTRERDALASPTRPGIEDVFPVHAKGCEYAARADEWENTSCARHGAWECDDCRPPCSCPPEQFARAHAARALLWKAKHGIAEAEVARLREALRPFAEDAAYFDACHAPDESSIHAWVVGRMPPRPRKDVTVGHLRAAARALAEGQT